jgi:serine/threonine protein kinase
MTSSHLARPMMNAPPAAAAQPQYHILSAITTSVRRSEVYKARVKNDILFVAIKRTPLAHLAEIERIVATQRRLAPHPNVCGIRALYCTGRHIYRVLDLCAGDSLHAVIQADAGFPEGSTRLFASDLLQGILHAHVHGVALGSFCPPHFLLDENGCVKVASFRGAKPFSDPSSDPAYYEPTLHAESLLYTAPEIVRAIASVAESALSSPGPAPALKTSTALQTPAGDLWSLGVCLWEIACGKAPWLPRERGDSSALPSWNAEGPSAFSARSAFLSLMKRPDLTLPWSELHLPSSQLGKAARDLPSPKLTHLLSRLLEVNPSKRADWKEVLAHPFWKLNEDESTSCLPEALAPPPAGCLLWGRAAGAASGSARPCTRKGTGARVGRT